MFQKANDNKNLIAANKVVANSEAFFKPLIQPKLTINQPDDEYEREADAMSEHVMRMTNKENPQQLFFKPSISFIHRKCAHCEEEEKKLQRKENNAGEGKVITISEVTIQGNPLLGVYEKIQPLVDDEVLPTGSKRLPQNPDSPAYNDNVQNIINSFLRIGSGKNLQEKLEDSRSLLSAFRGLSDKNSQSLLLRDAERYLWARAGRGKFAKEYGETFVGSAAPWASDVYNAYKTVLPESWIRSNADRPTSAVGGGAWFDKGLDDWENYDKNNLQKDQSPKLYSGAVNVRLQLN